LTTTSLGPIGNSGLVSFRYFIGRPIFPRTPGPLLNTDTIYVEVTANEGLTWQIIRKIHTGNHSTTSNWTNVTAGIPFGDGNIIRVRIRYQAVYQPLVNPPYSNTWIHLDDLEITSDTPTGVEPTKQKPKGEIVVYPNPTVSELNIQSQEPIEWIEVLDLSGKRLHLQEVNQTHWQTNLKQLRPGIFLLRVKTRDSLIVKKIVKQDGGY
jgi:hypothetical protein